MILTAAFTAVTVYAQSDPEQKDAAATITPPKSVFERPATQVEYERLQFETTLAFRRNDPVTAASSLEKSLLLSPTDPGDRYNMACALALLGKPDEALEQLDLAIEYGYRNIQHLFTDNDLESLRPIAKFSALALRIAELEPPTIESRFPEVIPSQIKISKALVERTNTVWDYRTGLFRSFFDIGEKKGIAAITSGFSKPKMLLRWWSARGTAAGNHGDLYDNFDGDHSNLAYAGFPQLSHVEYSAEAKLLKLHMGLQNRFLFNSVTVGNSSTAQVGTVFWRSQPRAAYAIPRGAALLHLQYTSNHIYVYVEHEDHDPGHNGEDGGYGDVFPANTPYVVISQGSSGSDQPFLEAIVSSLAAFKPEVKTKLTDTGSLMPAIQMILRRSNKNVVTDEDYLEGKAHPSVFDAAQLDPMRMIRMAHEIEPDNLPPRVALRVVKDSQGPAFGGETLFDTPQAIARVFRTVNPSRKMTISAEASSDPQGKPLKFFWKILRGDPEKIEITPLNEQGSVVDLNLLHHPRMPIHPGSEMESNRVDIGVFVNNGTHFSAPAFVSTYFPENETRIYDESGRLKTLDFTDPETKDNYADPMIVPTKNWRDEFEYNAEGELMGWTRHRGDATEEFDAKGNLVVARDDNGKISKVMRMLYLVEPSEDLSSTPQMKVMPSMKVEDATP